MLTETSPVKVKDEEELVSLTRSAGLSGLMPVVKLQTPVLKLVRSAPATVCALKNAQKKYRSSPTAKLFLEIGLTRKRIENLPFHFLRLSIF